MARPFFPILAFLLLLSQASAAETDENDLFRAAEEGDVGGIRQCLASGCSINVKDHAQMTPLHHAAMAKKPEVIRLLIERGADVNARDRYGMTPLLYSGMDPEIMKPLLEGGADVNARFAGGSTLLQNALIENRPEAAEILVEHGADLTLPHGITAIEFLDSFPSIAEEFKEAGVYQEMQNILRRPGSHPSPLH